MKKIIITTLLIFSPINYLSAVGLCKPVEVCSPKLEICSPKDDSQKRYIEELIKNFTPDNLIKEKSPEDLVLYEKVKDLFFEVDKKESINPFASTSREAICEKAKKNYNAQEITLTTEDNCSISAFLFERKNAPINLICATGYFDDQTPTKEWAFPYATLLPNITVLSFDWRGFGDSKSKNPNNKVCKFGTNSYKDIQAAIDYIRNKNDNPIVLIGFCAGAAMVLHATIKAQESNKSTADALILNSIFTRFENQINRAVVSENRWPQWIKMKLATTTGVAKLILDRKLNGNLYELNPIEMIEKIKVPCYFEHYTDDPSAIIDEGIEVYDKCPTFKQFTESNIGRHVRIHTVAPFQYREHFYNFLYKSNLLTIDQIMSLKSADSENLEKK